MQKHSCEALHDEAMGCAICSQAMRGVGREDLAAAAERVGAFAVEYRIQKAMADHYREALEDIADQSEHPHPKLPSAWAKGNRARQALGLTIYNPK